MIPPALPPGALAALTESPGALLPVPAKEAPPQRAPSQVPLYLPSEPRPELPAAILVDVDGTLALKGERDPFAWHKVGEDAPNWPVIVTVRNMQRAGYQLLIMSGRDGVCRQETLDWLKLHLGVPFAGLFMREPGDNRADYIVKEELYRQHVEGRYRILSVYDDRNGVVQLWRRLGLACFQVADGDF